MYNEKMSFLLFFFNEIEKENKKEVGEEESREKKANVKQLTERKKNLFHLFSGQMKSA